MKKRILSLILAAVLVVGLVPMAGAFDDVADEQVAARIEMLRGFEVINGYTDGTFRPLNNLTRAEFTKMTVMLLGGGRACETFGAYTIFGDVPSSDWAAKYINYAARDAEKGGLGLLKGYTDGTFRPSNTITYAEAVTIVLRGLGFSDADVGYNWPKNFIEKADSSGLGARVSRSANDAITRTDAVNLFYNALFVVRKDGSKLIDKMYGETIFSALILSVDGGVRIAEKPDVTYTNAAGLVSADVGSRKKLTLNEEGSAVVYAEAVRMQTSEKADAFIHSVRTEDGLVYVSLDGSAEVLCIAPIDESWVAHSAKLTADNLSGAIVKAELVESSNRTIAFGYYSGDRVTSVDGEVFTVKADTPTYTVEKGEMSASKPFSAVRDYLSYGDSLEFAIGADGAVKHVVARTGEANVALVAPGMTFKALRDTLGAPDGVTIYKNGAETEFSALSDYDAASYVPGSGAIMVSGFRLCASYSYAVPNVAAPEMITVFGNELTLAPCAKESVAKYKPLERMTLVFAVDGRVAGALEPTTARAVGVYSGSTVEFVGGPTLELTLDGFDSGELAAVGCGGNGQVVASHVAERSTNQKLDLEKMTLGDTPLAVGCVFFERASKGQTPVRIERDSIRGSVVSPSSILHVSYDAAGRANLIILGDVTGDRYEYGRVLLTVEERTITGMQLSTTYDARIISVENSEGVATVDVAQQTQLPSTLRASDSTSFGRFYAWGGMLTGVVDSPSGTPANQVTGYVELKHKFNADRTTFIGSSAVRLDGVSVPIADGVQVYLDSTKVFMKKRSGMSTLELVSAARAQSDKFELLLDAAPSDGGKVRVIVVK